jgi:acetylxylan esterase
MKALLRLTLAIFGVCSICSVTAADLTHVPSFGPNPGNLEMHLYVPDKLATPAPLLVAVHYCTGSAREFFSNSQFAPLADRYGYIVIYPSAIREGHCFDVASPQALTRGGGSDPVSIKSMIDYVIQNHKIDTARIYAVGVSSGAMMTNVLLALYPDVFKAGAAFAGVPYTCFATTDGSSWNNECSSGKITKTAREWGDRVRNAFPDYTGARPRIQLWHGTADEGLSYVNFGEAVKQWTDAHGLEPTPVFTDTPAPGQTRTRYGDKGPQAPIEAISLQDVPHDLPVNPNAGEVIRFFGLDVPGLSSSPGSGSSASGSGSSAR